MSRADPQPAVREYQRSRAVLMGTWEYSDTGLPSIPAARFSLDRMREVLLGPLCGWPDERVTVLRDELEPGNLADRLVGLFEDVSDVALFYYVGHGQPDENDQLCLGLGHTSSKANRRYNTSLPFDAVRRAHRQPRRHEDRHPRLLLRGPGDRGGEHPGRGPRAGGDPAERRAYTMCAASRSAKAMCETEGETPQTYFTKYLADVIEAGSPDGPVMVSLRSLFETTRAGLIRDGHPTPHDRISGDAHKYEFACNAVRTAGQGGVDSRAEECLDRTGGGARGDNGGVGRDIGLANRGAAPRDGQRDRVPRQIAGPGSYLSHELSPAQPVSSPSRASARTSWCRSTSCPARCRCRCPSARSRPRRSRS